MRVKYKTNLKLSRLVLIIIVTLLLLPSALLMYHSQDHGVVRSNLENVSMKTDEISNTFNKENAQSNYEITNEDALLINSPSCGLEREIIATPELTTRTRTGNTNINVTPQGSFSPAYLGDTDKDFYFTVFESYQGEHYIDKGDGIPEGNWHDKSLWNLSLTKMEFFFNNKPADPVVWDIERMTPDNNNGDGFLVVDVVNFLNDSISIPQILFRFDVKSSGLQVGNYELRLTFEYRILANYTASTGIYNWTFFGGLNWITEVESLNFEVRSCLSSPLTPRG